MTGPAFELGDGFVVFGSSLLCLWLGSVDEGVLAAGSECALLGSRLVRPGSVLGDGLGFFGS